ncbi:MAG TPA: YeeE/YedE thiosulfate transporter family protein, partial [Thermoanaerobaculia bacterium]
GVFWLVRLGVISLASISVPETYLVPQLLGGLIFGAGFVAAGLCPGTSCVSAASGRADGLAVVLGLFTGVLLCGAADLGGVGLYNTTPRGPETLPQLLHVPYGVVVFAVVAMALTLFTLAERFRPVS